MTRLDPRLSAFLERCDRVTTTLDRKRSWLSTKLFNDGKRLAKLSSGDSDIGIARLAKAEADLVAFESQAFTAKAA